MVLMLYVSTSGINIFSRPVRIPTVKCVLNKYSVSASSLVSTDFNQKVKSLRNEVESRGKRRVLRQGHRDTVTSQYPKGLTSSKMMTS